MLLGLHGLLKSIQKPCHLKKFSGQTLGVDAYGWLHRGTVACAVDLVLDRPTTKHIDFVLGRVRMLLYFGVKPYLVFDGDNLPSKSGTEIDRQQRRHESKSLGMELLRKGRTAEAYQELQKAVDVTPLMARQLIEELKKLDIPYVVAPYEADAQLVYLEQQGIIDGIISEDSDLLVYGAKRLLSKLDQHGDLIEINRADFSACREVSFVGWTDADFRRMCILSGCDYLPNITRVGLKTAYRSIRKYKNVEKALRMLQFDGHHVPPDYLQSFKQAELTFLYQRVFCPKAGKLVTLTLPDNNVNLDEIPFIGDDMEPETAVGVANGDLDPTSKGPLRLVVKSLNSGQNKPVPSLNRRQTIGSFSDLKPSKPINSFFTPKRVPLAELDPNSLTPSPSQQRLLHHHANSSWEPSPAPSRPSVVRSATLNDSSNRVSSPLVRSAERSSFLARASKLSTLQPSKRQRLCSETEEISPVNTPDSRSRFFAAGSNDTTPSGGQKLNRPKKARKSTLDVFSDDMAEDIMSQLPDPSEAAKISAKKAQTVTNTDEIDNKELELTNTDGPTTVKGDADSSQAEVEEPTTQTALESVTPSKTVSANSEPHVFSQVLDYHIKRQNSTILSKYSFKSNAGGTRPDPHLSGANGTEASAVRKVDFRGTGTPKQPKRLTPLQRLGQNALARSRSLNNMPASPSIWRSPNRFENRSSVSPGNHAPAASQGSEDLIVPDSEEEDDGAPDTAVDRSQLAALDLKRFSFTTR
ncbi:putative exonuclease [Aspergillus mulundensis]|uniref:5'-3' exonuclease and flap-endonuclease n=1 Tax=Aspergillus mulundensis TaxID=1810919 RepID=A0A3D8SKR0_9EURO|nr:5'-3' exonuclease and flap-endonuclease [Aspergillus mulundensis]RDW86761.1 5'-3' exonuclease and flap-endonuclease [Aspergillus mulundensis]